ncbi:MAG: GH1 family beta-glucosidase [Spirochaetales bacterium]|uniref:Beta-glucosidase n=1 Tax=Candidatus Thalassospirochaeta sargassi TaxID=3119039 RepID=A0AAJ1IE23_9SPIO|nr:GH1 family beta-glucosidase [Spirochaetales bacterium]
MISKKQEYTVSKSELGKKPLFPEGMIFGAATAAYQIEGSAGEDGRGPSVWDIFSHKRGRVYNNDNGDQACDHYKRYRDDVSIMSRIGLDAYRFSISWPRVLPEGRGAVNRKGLDFYDKLVDELLLAGIRPFATLFHWDYPYQLYRSTGGFEKRSSAHYFADYAEVVVNKLGDRVKDWITLNEPWVHSTLGYLLGVHAPGVKKPIYWSRTVHNQLLAHAWAMERIKTVSPASRVGITLNISPVDAWGDSAMNRSVVDIADQFQNRVFLDPLFKGEYPRQLMRKLNLFWPDVSDADMDLISRPMNFLGINLYTRKQVFYAPWIPFLGAWFKENRIPNKEYIRNGVRYTSMGWEVYPESLYNALTAIRDNYGNIPVYVTENGAAFNDKLSDYRVHDDARVQFLYEYTAQAARAAAEGCDLRGYFAWSLLDNFEWAEGYRKRFGLVYVDYENQRRTIKDSGYWYKDLILANKR